MTDRWPEVLVRVCLHEHFDHWVHRAMDITRTMNRSRSMDLTRTGFQSNNGQLVANTAGNLILYDQTNILNIRSYRN